MEGREWIWDNGVLKPVVVEQYKKAIENTPAHKLEEQALRVFKDFISRL
jgi:hypothetical protein